MSTGAPTTQPVKGGSRVRTRALAVVVAVAVAVVVWLVAKAAGAELKVDQGSGPQDVSLVSVVFSGALASLLGWGLLALLERLTPKAKTIWTAVAVGVLVLSLLPAVLVDASSGTKVTLVLLHLTIGAIVIPAFRKDARSA